MRRVDLNIASKPFGRSRLFWLPAVSAAAALLAAAGLLTLEWLRFRETPDQAAVAEQRLRLELQRLTAEENELRARIQAPETIDVFDRAHFLNQLLTRKGISWTKTFADLETVLPPRVLMMQIRPETTFDNRVELEMQVGAETPEDFIAFLIALEGSEMFGPPSPRGYAPPNDNEPYHRYQLTVRYEQRL